MLNNILKKSVNHGAVKGSSVKAISFVVKSGTGKTTLLVMVIRELNSRGYRVGETEREALG